MFFIFRYYKMREDDCSAETNTELNYDTLFGLFLILLCGVGLSVLLLSWELIFGYRKLRKTKMAGNVRNLLDMTERELLLAKIDRMKEKIDQQQRLIDMLNKSY